MLTSLLGSGLFRFLNIIIIKDGGASEGWQQFLDYAGPCGVLAAAGATLSWPVHGAATSREIRGLAAAAVIVGTVIAVGVRIPWSRRR